MNIERARGCRPGRVAHVRFLVEFGWFERGLFDAGSRDHRPDELSAGVAEFVAIVGLLDEVAGRFVEVVVELAAIVHPHPVAQLRKRDGVILRERLVYLPKGQQDRQPGFVSQKRKRFDGPRARDSRGGFEWRVG